MFLISYYLCTIEEARQYKKNCYHQTSSAWNHFWINEEIDACHNYQYCTQQMVVYQNTTNSLRITTKAYFDAKLRTWVTWAIKYFKSLNGIVICVITHLWISQIDLTELNNCFRLFIAKLKFNEQKNCKTRKNRI